MTELTVDSPPALVEIIVEGDTGTSILTPVWGVVSYEEPATVDIDSENPPAIIEVVAYEEPVIEIASEGLPGEPGPPGPPGPAGPQGPPGSGGGSGTDIDLLFSFASPSTTWVIHHNQDTYALVVETFDQNGDPLEGYVVPVDSNTINVYWFYPTAGTARVFR